MLSADSFRRCLKDEATATRVAEAIADAGEATARANQEAGKVTRLEKALGEERGTSDERLVRNVRLEQRVGELERRPKKWVVVVITAAAVVVGGAGGYAVGRVSQ